MSSGHRRTAAKAAKGVAVNVAVAGVVSIGAAVAFAATAAADDPPPPPPAPDAPAPPPDIPQTATGTMTGLLNQSTSSPTGFDMLLSQTAVPALPGAQPPAPPDFSAVNSLPYLFGPNMMLSEQGQQSMYSNGPTDPNAPAPNGRIDAFKRAHGIWHEGMGRLDLAQLGQPLPGTAPPPGTNLPPGPVQFLPDDYGAPPPPPGAPPPPLPPGG